MSFCDYCTCEDCRTGAHGLKHAKTIDGRYICDVCYTYDVCVIAQRKEDGYVTGPCEDTNCKHRPKLVTPWTTRDEDEFNRRR